MAYSFTEPIDDSSDESFDDDDPPKPPPPMMVPMADILNAVNDNNACLEFGDEALKMVATCSIQTVCIFVFCPFSVGIDSRCQILTSKIDPRTERVKYIHNNWRPIT